MASTNNGCDQPNVFKRKKKRSLNQQVKKRFKKSEKFSKGDRVEQVLHEYFLRVFEMEQRFAGTTEEKCLFVNNALAQTEGQEVELSRNQLISRVIQNLLPLASNEVLERYFEVFGANLRPICVHSFASHVLQTLMIIATRHSLEDVTVSDDKHKVKCSVWLLKVCRFVLNNIEEFIWDTMANRVLRTALVCLAGKPHLDKHVKSESKPEQEADESAESEQCPPEIFLDLLDEFCQRVLNFPQIKDFVEDSLTSGFLQTLLFVLKYTKNKKYKNLCKKILADCFPSSEDKHIPVMFSPVALPVLEVMVELGKKKMLKEIYDRLVARRLTEMATARVAKFMIQKFINKCSSPEMMAEITTSLVPEFHKIIASNSAGVLVSLSEACERLNTSQSEFYQGVMNALNYDSSEEALKQLVPALLSLTPLPHNTTPTTTRDGSLLLQSLFRFKKPIKLVRSLLLYEPKELASLLSSQYGCYITGAFCKSAYVGEKSRQKLIQRLVGHYPFLAQSKFGSRSFDDLWEVADMKDKLRIVTDLASDYSQVMKSKYGAFVSNKVALKMFRSEGADKWKVAQQSKQKKKQIFASIIGDVQ